MAKTLQELYDERDALRAELEACQEQAAWCLASDSAVEQREGQQWQRQAQALRVAVGDCEAAILRAELDSFG